MSDFRFELMAGGASGPRLGRVHTAHGAFDTPAFLPVGTLAAVKTLSPAEVRETGAGAILANTYHLHLRPGESVVRELGGLHRFMNWDGPIVTDSGGFQVFSLSELRTLTPEGVHFRSHLDGSSRFLSPESAVGIQEDLGSDIMMVLDECLPYPATGDQAAASLELTLDWAARCKAAWKGKNALFGIVQGGAYAELRLRGAQRLREIGFSGYALGGFAVGEPPALMNELVGIVAPTLPPDSPRYLMGVGTPTDLIEAVERGVDFFDCVLPTRNARNGTLYTRRGKINVDNAKYVRDFSGIDEACACYTCASVTKAYLSHLFRAKEMLAGVLATIHNLHFLVTLVKDIRAALIAGKFGDFEGEFLTSYVVRR